MTIRRKVAAGLGGLALMLGAVGGAVAVTAAPPLTTPPAVTQPAQAEAPETTDPAETPVDPSTVKITADQAQAAALAKFPGATINNRKVELQDENGTLVWGVALTDISGTVQDVKIDANTGAILSAQADAPEGAGPEVSGD